MAVGPPPPPPAKMTVPATDAGALRKLAADLRDDAAITLQRAAELENIAARLGDSGLTFGMEL